MASLKQQSLPVIDFTNKHLAPNSSAWASIRQDVVRALEECTCFIAVYDKLAFELNDAVFRATKELFDLPTETKVLNISDLPSNGYVGQIPRFPLYEALGIENATTLDGVQKFTNLLWPNRNESFSETALSYSKIVANLDQTVMRMVTEAYGIEKSYEKLYGSMYYLLKLIKYRVPQENEENLGVIAHTDKSFVSVLHQHQVKGLEIKTKDGEWIAVDPSPSSFVVMAGDVFMAWTNGRVEPTQHRVIMPRSVERYSLGLFTFIKDLVVEVPEELVDDKHPLQYKPFDHHKFVHFYYTDEGKQSKCPIKAYCGA